MKQSLLSIAGLVCCVVWLLHKALEKKIIRNLSMDL